MKYQIKCADPEQRSMFYSDCDPALRNACVGHLRMDFGSDNEFWNTWWGNRDDLNDSAFKAELNDVVNELRKDGLLKNRSEMRRYCATHQNLNLNESYGFSVETADRLFLLRCRPERGNYDCYMLRDGIGIEKDGEQAENYFKNAYNGFAKIANDNPDDKIIYRLGVMTFSGTGCDADRDLGLEYIKQSAELGNEYAQAFLDNSNRYNLTAAQNAVLSMLFSFGKLISDDYNRSLHGQKLRTEHKLKAAIRRKKQALGIKENPLENQQFGE